MKKNPTIMLLGTAHLGGWGGNYVNHKMDDMFDSRRQTELQQLAEQLAEFNPTKVAVQVDHLDTAFSDEYGAYVNGKLQLKRHEMHQIGFRLAKQMGHLKIYCVDYWPWPDRNPFFPDEFDWNLTDYMTFAKTHNQEHFLFPVDTSEGKVEQDENGEIWIEPEYEPMIDMHIRLNQPDRIIADQASYLRVARIGLEDEYPGANWLAHSWFDRNLKIFVNLTRITESADDRILFIVASGHVYLIQQYLESSQDYIIESPLQYLDAERIEISV